MRHRSLFFAFFMIPCLCVSIANAHNDDKNGWLVFAQDGSDHIYVVISSTPDKLTTRALRMDTIQAAFAGVAVIDRVPNDAALREAVTIGGDVELLADGAARAVISLEDGRVDIRHYAAATPQEGGEQKAAQGAAPAEAGSAAGLINHDATGRGRDFLDQIRVSILHERRVDYASQEC